MPNRERWGLAAALLLGWLLRFAAAHAFWNGFDREFPQVWETSKSAFSQDGTQYVLQAGPPCWKTPFFRKWAEQPFYRPPAASYYFALLFRAVDFHRRAAAAVQSLLAVVAYGLLYLLARRLLGRGTAAIALGLLLTHPLLAYYDMSFEDSTLAFLLLTGALFLGLRPLPTVLSDLAAGALAGLTVLARPNLAIAFVVLAPFLLRTPQRLLRMTVPCVAVIALAVVHNYRASGRWSFVTETGGENLYWGNNGHPEYRATLQGFWAIRAIDFGSPEYLLVDGFRREFQETSIDAAFGAAARDYIRQHPGDTAIGLAQKALRHLASDEIPRNESWEWLRAHGMALPIPVLPYPAIFLCAVIGSVAVWRRRERTGLVLLAPWLAVLASEVLYFNAARYRALGIPFLMPLAVSGVWTMVAAARRREIAGPVAASIGLVVLCLASTHIVSENERQAHRSASEFKAAMLQAYGDSENRLRLLDERRFAEHLQRSLDLDPDNLDAFSVWQKYQILQRRSQEVADAVRDRRARCGSDALCLRTCDFLSEARQGALGPE
jgi:4-amino-4-deoxy-L-arabinose transferase-like glycosyltransferase